MQTNTMRTIKFRGRRLDNGKWWYGSLVILNGRYFIFNDEGRYEVSSATVGQYTGLKDKAGQEIYEGDILCVTSDFGEIYNREVYYLDDGFRIHLDDETEIQSIVRAVESYDAEIIGNIHDNPELLKGGEQ